MPYYDDDSFPAYVSVQERRQKAARHVAQQKKKGKFLRPVLPIAGAQIARTFWGKAWCKHLEGQADLYNRLSRGRSYVRHGAVVDLRIEPGRVLAQVLGSALYRVEVTIKPLPAKRWAAIVKRCHGQIDSLVDLLQGRLSSAVMELLTESKSGVLPEAAEIKFACSCPDYASMCKHVSAVLYATGSRLDTEQAELFVLRQVDHGELVQQAMRGATDLKSADTNDLGGADLSALFDIDLGGVQEPTAPVKRATRTRKASKVAVAKPVIRKKKKLPSQPKKRVRSKK